jgi:hypothetical protein
MAAPALECLDCGTICLDISTDVIDFTPIHSSCCGKFLGHWRELERDFAEQGGGTNQFRIHTTRYKGREVSKPQAERVGRFLIDAHDDTRGRVGPEALIAIPKKSRIS